eukprot:CAMPEP_0206136230 /NCGR_PEP_ID=MMETSP1473-20131121/1468_1 /ASSEMBLY_ACC=CAM_ASM_001109 /TAXON_ID=1461547 /ORGANISM="Stichococcus sp, Strain RCC1054" /LENGTH=48 /DNA_ID= /DNA_START= /DNA_END= /DNA_ORIENTATION=
MTCSPGGGQRKWCPIALSQLQDEPLHAFPAVADSITSINGSKSGASSA